MSHSSPFSQSGSLINLSISAKEGSEVSIEEGLSLRDNPLEETILPEDLLTDNIQKSIWNISDLYPIVLVQHFL